MVSTTDTETPSDGHTTSRGWPSFARLNRRRVVQDMGPVGLIVRFFVLLGMGIFFGLPLLWLLLAPTKTDDQFFFANPLSFGSFARLGEAWHNLLSYQNGIVLTWTVNSVFYVVASILIQLAITIPAGYALATASFAGRSLTLSLTLVTMVLPAAAVVLPEFLELNLFHLTDSAWAVILPAAFYPFGVYIAYIYYSTTLPKDLLAAGRIDGANEWQLFWNIGLPLARPLVGVLTFLSFNANWNNFFAPYVFLQTDTTFNLPVGLYTLMNNTTALHPEFASTLPIHRAEVALTGVIMVLPVALIFIFAQRSISSGIVSGSTRE